MLTPEGHVLDQHVLTCEDDDEAKQCANVLADGNPIEIWDGPIRIERFDPKTVRPPRLAASLQSSTMFPIAFPFLAPFRRRNG